MTVWAKYRYYVDWNNDGDYGESYEDITDYVISVSWEYGRENASQLEGRSIAGNAEIILDNSTGIFSSYNSGSPLWGNVLPNRLCKITMQIGSGTVYTKFEGYLDSLRPDPGAVRSESTATLRAHGVLGFTEEKKATVEMEENITTGAAIGKLLDAISFPVGKRVITGAGHVGKSTIGRWWENPDTNVLEAIRRLEETECGFVRESQDGKIVFEDRSYRLGASVSASYTNDPAGSIRYTKIQQEDSLRGIKNKIIATVRTFDIASGVLLWKLPGDPPTIAANGGTLTITAKFPSPQTQSGFLAVDDWGIIDIFLNDQADGLGNDIASSFTINTVKTAHKLEISLTNNGSVLGYLTLAQARGDAVVEGDSFEISDSDNTSIGKFGEIPYNLPGAFIEAVNEAKELTSHLVTVYKDPIPAVTLELNANANSNHLTEALMRDVSDKIHIDADANAGLYIDHDFFVERIRHEVLMRYPDGVDCVHRMTLMCVQVSGHDWDTSTSSYTAKDVSGDNMLHVPDDLTVLAYVSGTRISTGCIAWKWNDGIYEAEFRARLQSPTALERNNSYIYASIESDQNYTVPTAAGTLAFWVYPLGEFFTIWHTPGGLVKDISSGWVFATATGEPEMPHDPVPDYVFGFQGGGGGGATISAGWKSISSDKRVSVSGSELPAGVWSHVILTWQNGGDTKLYINNVLKGTTTDLDATFDTSAYKATFLSGLEPQTHCFGGGFGRVTQAGVWNAVLSPSERAALQTKRPNEVAAGSLYDYWPFQVRANFEPLGGWAYEYSTGSNAAAMKSNNYIGIERGIALSNNASVEYADLRTPAEGGDLVHDGKTMFIVPGLKASQWGANYTFNPGYPGVWFMAYKLKNLDGWSVWSDGNDVPLWVKDHIDTSDPSKTDTGPPEDWTVIVEEGAKPNTVRVRATRPQINGNTILFVMFQIKNAREGLPYFVQLDSDIAPAHTYYDGSVVDHSYDQDTFRITRLSGVGFGEITIDSDMGCMYDVRENGSFNVDHTVWNAGLAKNITWETGDPQTSTWFELTNAVSYLQAGSGVRIKFMRPPWTWDTGGYFGGFTGSGFSGKEYWKIKNDDGSCGDQSTQEFISDSMPIPAGLEVSDIIARVWFYNAYSASDGGICSALGTKGGVQVLPIVDGGSGGSGGYGPAAVYTDVRLGNCFVVYVDQDFTLMFPTNLTKWLQPIVWVFIQVGNGGQITLDPKFRTSGFTNLIELSQIPGAKDYMGGMYDADDDVMDIVSFVPDFEV